MNQHRIIRKIALLLSLMLGAQEACADDLLVIYKLAQKNDPQIQAAAAKLKADQQAVPQSRSSLLPQIEASAGKDRVHEERTSSGTTIVNSRDPQTGLLPFPDQPENALVQVGAGTTKQSFNEEFIRVNAKQSIYHHDQWLALAKAKRQAQQAELRYTAEQKALMIRTAERYFNVLTAQDGLAFAEAEKKAIGLQLEQTKQRFDVGVSPITDVHEAEARYDQALSNEIIAKNQLDNAEEALREVTGQAPTTLATLRQDFPQDPPQPTQADHWVKLAEERNLGLRAERVGVEIARYEVKQRFAGHFPTLDLEGNYLKSEDNRGGGRLEFDAPRIGVRLRVPIFSGGLTHAQTEEAKYLLEQAQFNLEQAHRGVIRSTRSAYLGVLAAIGNAKASKQAELSSASALEATQAGYSVGTRTIVDVLQSTQLLYLARKNLSQARSDYVLNWLRLKQAAGDLSEADVQRVNSWLVQESGRK